MLITVRFVFFSQFMTFDTEKKKNLYFWNNNLLKVAYNCYQFICIISFFFFFFVDNFLLHKLLFVLLFCVFFFFVFKLLFCKFTVLTYKVIKEGFYLKTQREGLITTILSTWLIRWRCLRSVSVQSMLADWLRFFFGRQFHDEWWLTDSLMFYVYSNVTKLYILKLSSPSLTVSETEILYEAMLESSFIC